MNSRWQANKIGLINFWYYDEQEFPFVKGRILLRGSNGSGKSVTMQSVVPLLLDGNMSPERLDPFGSRDRKMSSYLLEEDDGRDERTGYLYLEFKRKDSETYMTVGMGIRARRGKPLDKWYFGLTDGRRVGKDFYLYKDMGEKVTLSKKELENRIGTGGRVIDRQVDYMDYVNRQIFGFDTPDEYKELVDLLIQLRTPKLSKDFKPSVINDILSDSLQPLSDEDLRPMSEAIENMDTMNMNLKSRKEAKQAAEKINTVFNKYNKLLLFDKADRLVQVQQKLEDADKAGKELQNRYEACLENIKDLEAKIISINAKKDTLEKERESLGKSDAFALKEREAKLGKEICEHEKTIREKNVFLSSKEEKYRDVECQIKDEEDRRYEKEKELNALLEEMQDEAERMSFQEFSFMQEELCENIENEYKFELHRQQFGITKKNIIEGMKLLEDIRQLDIHKEELVQKREKQIRELDMVQRKISELESVLVQVENEWKEALYKWNEENTELKLERGFLGELSIFADDYNEKSDFAIIRRKISEKWTDKDSQLQLTLNSKRAAMDEADSELDEIKTQLKEWENQKEPQPERTEAVIKNRDRLKEAGIPYQEFYKVIEFDTGLSDEACNHLEEALLKMGILDAIVVDEQYKEQVLKHAAGCEDHYLFASKAVEGKSLLDVLELNDEVNDIFSNQRLTSILSNISYDEANDISVMADGTYHMGVLNGTITGEYTAGFLGTKARERNRQLKIAECKNKIAAIEAQIDALDEECNVLSQRKRSMKEEYENLPDDKDMREALNLLLEQERQHSQIRAENEKLDEQLTILMEEIKDKRKAALEISEKLYLTCSYDNFADAKEAAEEYDKALVRLAAVHELLIRSISYMKERRRHIEDLDYDMDQVRYDIRENEKLLDQKKAERKSILEQLALTDYEEIKERLDACVNWLAAYPALLEKTVGQNTQAKDEAEAIKNDSRAINEMISDLEKKMVFLQKCYTDEYNLRYVTLPQEITNTVKGIRDYLKTDVKGMDKESVVSSLNQVFYENRSFLTDYQLTQNHLFEDDDVNAGVAGFSAKRLDISARYQGVKVSFSSLLIHLGDDIAELENLIKDGDRELFEDILANTVSRKIRGKINASNTWVQKMNSLMNGMDTSSGLKLSLRWRSKTAEKEDQLDTRELVELLKKDYRLMSEEEAAKLSAHFRSKVEEARRNARDSAGMISFYQIMKETLDYRKWFEFQLFSQKSGERQKELTNSVFGTFSGGEKAMSMYVPLFSAVVAKYQGGREDAPRLISLDEAFAGVDNKNIRDMFRLMTQFEFDFIINSQVLWGDCDTLDALAIYQLIRPENAKFVTVMPYLWNGRRKELLEDEEQVSQRAAELNG